MASIAEVQAAIGAIQELIAMMSEHTALIKEKNQETVGFVIRTLDGSAQDGYEQARAALSAVDTEADNMLQSAQAAIEALQSIIL